MLAALLTNLPEPVTASGPDRGYTRQAASSTSWNPEWSKKYGPDAEKAKSDVEKIKEVVKEFKEVEYVPPEISYIKEMVHSRSLVDELNDFESDTNERIVLMLKAYFYFCDWRKKDEEDMATILLLM